MPKNASRSRARTPNFHARVESPAISASDAVEAQTYRASADGRTPLLRRGQRIVDIGLYVLLRNKRALLMLNSASICAHSAATQQSLPSRQQQLINRRPGHCAAAPLPIL